MTCNIYIYIYIEREREREGEREKEREGGVELTPFHHHRSLIVQK